MYTTDCKDPNCDKCKQASEGQSSGEKSKILKGVEQRSEENEFTSRKKRMEAEAMFFNVRELISKEIQQGQVARREILASCAKVKSAVHREISSLIDILRKREIQLHSRIEFLCYDEIANIDIDAVDISHTKKMEKCKERKPITALVFNSDYYALKMQLERFGELSYEAKTEQSEDCFKLFQRRENWPFLEPDFSALSEKDSKTTSRRESGYVTSFEPLEMDYYRCQHSSLHEKVKRGEKKQEDLKLNTKDKFPKGFQILQGKRPKFQPNIMELEEKGLEEFIKNSEKPSDEIETAHSLAREQYRKAMLLAEEAEKRQRRSAEKDEPDRLSAQIKKRFQTLDAMSKSYEMSPHGFDSTDSVPCNEHKSVKMAIEEKLKDLEAHREALIRQVKKESLVRLHSTPVAIGGLEKRSSLSAPSIEWHHRLDNIMKCMKSTAEEIAKESSSDDEMEIISRDEAANIPSEASLSPPLPPKNRLKFKKPLCFSLLRKKEVVAPPLLSKKNAESESSDIGRSESCEGSVGSSNAEMKANSSSNEQPEQASSSGSKDVDGGHNPSQALRCSFTKYLEKNLEGEWLAPDKSSKQLSAGDQEIHLPILHDIDQWLPAERKQNVDSKWLHPANM